MANGDRVQAVETPRVSQEIVPAPALRYPVPIEPTPLQMTPTNIVAAPDGVDSHIESLIAVNVTGSSATMSVHIVPAGGAANAGNAVAFNRSVPTDAPVVLFSRDNMLLIPPGSSLVATCETDNAINLFGFRFEYLGVTG